MVALQDRQRSPAAVACYVVVPPVPRVEKHPWGNLEGRFLVEVHRVGYWQARAAESSADPVAVLVVRRLASMNLGASAPALVGPVDVEGFGSVAVVDGDPVHGDGVEVHQKSSAGQLGGQVGVGDHCVHAESQARDPVLGESELVSTAVAFSLLVARSPVVLGPLGSFASEP